MAAHGSNDHATTGKTPSDPEHILLLSIPEIIVLGPPSVFRKYEKEFCDRFRILKPWESPVPLEQFISEHAQNAQAMFTSGVVKRVGADILSLLPCLRLIVTASAGVNNIDLGECRHRGVSLATAPTVASTDVAELALGLLIDVLRRISAGNRFVKAGLWTANSDRGPFPLANKLSGKRVGIVGLGNIGQEVAKRLEGFDCKISYYSRNQKSSVSYPFYSDVSELAAHSDILVICCALTDETHHLITKEVLVALGEQGVIVNVARGAIIDEKELVHFLQEGKIAGAGLDVFEHEPNIPRQLFGMDNVVLSPHFGVFTEESFRDLYDLVVGNLEAFFSNKPLISPVVLEG